MSISPGTVVQMIDQFGVPQHLGLFMAKLKPKDDVGYSSRALAHIDNSDQWHWQVIVDNEVRVFNISFWTPIPI